jgi:uncharacterized protein YbbK (DUF523 family)
MIKVLVSSCLLGERVRYHGGDALCESAILDRWHAEGRLVPVCPETTAGLPVPRPPAEIGGGDGHAVLEGQALVSDSTGLDVTASFVQGAQAMLELATRLGARLAVLKDGSPSCGSSYVFDGTFRGQRDRGQGVTAAMLSRAGIRVFNERELDEAARYVESLDAGAKSP